MQPSLSQRSSPPGTSEPEQSPPRILISPQKPLSPVPGYAASHLDVVSHGGTGVVGRVEIRVFRKTTFFELRSAFYIYGAIG